MRGGSLDLVRWAGVAAWLLVGVTSSLRMAPELGRLAERSGGGHPAVAVALLWGVTTSAWLLFGATYLWNTRTASGGRLSWARVGALVVGAACAVAYNTDLLFLVAVEVPLVLAGRAALAWMVGQSVLTLAAAASVAGTPDFDPIFCGSLEAPRAWIEGLTMIAIVVWQWLAFAVGTTAAREREARAELLRTNGELQATRGLLADNARIAERLRISREIHDSVGHGLTALSVTLDLAARRTEGPPAADLREAHGLVQALLGEVRHVVADLRGGRLVELRRALLTLGASVSRPRVRVQVDDDVGTDPLRAHALYRCAQEGLTNAVRHAGAETVSMSLRREGAALVLEVSDDGHGARGIAAGAGLSGLRERLEEVGGRLDTASPAGGGFVLRAVVPARAPS